MENSSDTLSRISTVLGLIGFFGVLAFAAHACKVPAVPVHKQGNLLCKYKDYVIFNGDIELKGSGADQFEMQLSGVHEFCRDPDIWCELNIEEVVDGGQ